MERLLTIKHLLSLCLTNPNQWSVGSSLLRHIEQQAERIAEGNSEAREAVSSVSEIGRQAVRIAKGKAQPQPDIQRKINLPF